MKRVITTLAACGAVLAVAVPAQAAPMDPVRALEAELTPGHGVRFTETVSFVDGLEERPSHKRKGAFEFDKKGVKDYDVTTNPDAKWRERAIRIGDIGYFCGIDARATYGRTWYRLPLSKFTIDELFHFSGQVINPAEPATLDALVKKGS